MTFICPTFLLSGVPLCQNADIFVIIYLLHSLYLINNQFSMYWNESNFQPHSCVCIVIVYVYVFPIVIVYVLCLYVFSVSLVCCHYQLELHGAAVVP